MSVVESDFMSSSIPSVSPSTVGDILSPLGILGALAIQPVRERNHVYRITTSERQFFLKIHTKH